MFTSGRLLCSCPGWVWRNKHRAVRKLGLTEEENRCAMWSALPNSLIYTVCCWGIKMVFHCDISISVQISMTGLMVTALRLEWSCCSAGQRLLPGSDPVVLQHGVLSWAASCKCRQINIVVLCQVLLVALKLCACWTELYAQQMNPSEKKRFPSRFLLSI